MSKMSALASKRSAVLVAASLLLPAPLVDAQEAGANENCFDLEGPLRRRPGYPLPSGEFCEGVGLTPAIWSTMPDFVAVPDRWRIVSALGYPDRKWDPYNGNNVLKATVRRSVRTGSSQCR